MVRKTTGLSRVAAARLAGIDSSLLVRIEHCRTALKYGAARDLANALDIDPCWLATGKGHERSLRQLPQEPCSGIAESVSFSEAFDQFLAIKFPPYDLDGYDHYVDKAVAIDSTPDPRGRLVAERELFYRIQSVLDGVSDENFNRILNRLSQLAFDSWTPDSIDSQERIPWRIKEMTRLRKLGLPRQVSTGEAKTIDTLPGEAYDSATEMKNLWQPWKNRLKKVCAPDGAKARCARELQVSRQLVSKWLEKTEPTADFALRLIGWIEKEERAMAGK